MLSSKQSGNLSLQARELSSGSGWSTNASVLSSLWTSCTSALTFIFPKRVRSLAFKDCSSASSIRILLWRQAIVVFSQSTFCQQYLLSLTIYSLSTLVLLVYCPSKVRTDRSSSNQEKSGQTSGTLTLASSAASTSIWRSLSLSWAARESSLSSSAEYQSAQASAQASRCSSSSILRSFSMMISMTASCRRSIDRITYYQSLQLELICGTPTSLSPRRSNLLSRAVKEDFHLLNKIGEGRHCAVYEAQNKFDGEVRAIKVIMKGKRSKEEIVNEVELMRRLDHPNIIRLFEVYESSKLVTLVLEHCRGGELFRYLCREKSLRESTAASIMAQILSAVAYLHEAGITHRDVKPENVLLKFEDNVKSIKLIDFGISLKKDELTQIRGSEYYLAPEAFTGAHSRQVDLWAAGVLLYMLVSGRLPFCGHNFHETISLITHSPVDYSLPQFGHTSPELLDLLHGLLQKDPTKRFTAIEAYGHRWFDGEKMKYSEKLFPLEVFQSLKEIVELKVLRKSVVTCLALQVPEEEIEQIRKMFVKTDKNGNGLISKEEFDETMQRVSEYYQVEFSKDFREKVFRSMDFNHNGNIDYTEFLACLIDCSANCNHEFLARCFRSLDVDKDGAIELEELRKLANDDLWFSFGLLSPEEMFRQLDADSDGKVTLQEFAALFKS